MILNSTYYSISGDFWCFMVKTDDSGHLGTYFDTNSAPIIFLLITVQEDNCQKVMIQSKLEWLTFIILPNW